MNRSTDVENGESVTTSTTTVNTNTTETIKQKKQTNRDDYVGFQMNFLRYKSRYDEHNIKKSELIYLQLIVFNHVIMTLSSGTLFSGARA